MKVRLIIGEDKETGEKEYIFLKTEGKKWRNRKKMGIDIVSFNNLWSEFFLKVDLPEDFPFGRKLVEDPNYIKQADRG